MKYKTVIYTRVRAEITHNDEFAGNKDALARIIEEELLDYASILGGSTSNRDMRVTAVEVVTDKVQEYNLVADEEYQDE